MPTKEGSQWPVLTFPMEEANLLRARYEKARVILEYGSGGSTVMAAQQPGKLIFSVESDLAWSQALQHKIDVADLPSSVILYHVNIGETARWGRPVDDSGWRFFYRYPVAIWNETFFRQPDLVLIDGRFRAACFITTCLFTKQPVTIIFDDYVERPSYHVVEELAKPVEITGRMARFEIEPKVWPSDIYTLLLRSCTQGTYSYQSLAAYSSAE